MKDIWKIIGFTALAYVYDVIYRPHQIARQARESTNKSGKPVLNIGAGTPRSSLRVWLLGPTLWGDVNMDLAASPKTECQPNLVCFGDAATIPYPDKYFGSVIASHVLEHVEDPQKVLQELHRVAEEVFIITPLWWCPHTYLHPGHRWWVAPDGKYYALWQK